MGERGPAAGGGPPAVSPADEAAGGREATTGAGAGEAAGGERERAVAAALELYRRAKESGADLSAGPCLAQEAIPGWAVDVAHEPRQPVDDDPANQCASYREGRATHFVELDPEGNVIRVY